MKKILIISLFVLAMIIPNINVKAVDVSNEEELRNAIEQGGDITLTKDIEVKEPLVIDKDVNISGRRIMMQGDNTLMTINSGNVILSDVVLGAGLNSDLSNFIKNQGTAVVVNEGTVNFENTSVSAGKVGIEINGGTVTGNPRISAGELNFDETNYTINISGGKGVAVNGGTVNFAAGSEIQAGNVGISIKKDSIVNFPESTSYNPTHIYSSKIGLELDGGTFSGYFTIIAGWDLLNYSDVDHWNSPIGVTKGQGTAIVINSGNYSLGDLNMTFYTGDIGIEVNGGTVTSIPIIYAGVKNENGTYSGGRGLVINGGKVELNYDGNYWYDNSNHRNPVSIINSGGNAIEVSNDGILNISSFDAGYYKINSYEGNSIEVKDGGTTNISEISLFGSKNAIYLNGGTVNLNGRIGLGSSTEGKGIYINKGANTKIDGDVLNLGKDFVFSYEEGTTPNFSIYVNHDIQELKVTDEKNFMELLDNKLSLGFCSKSFSLAGPNSQSEEERKATCSALGNGANYDGPIYSNELGKCTTVYINGVKQNEPDASCTPVAEDENTENNQGPQIVEVPSTSAYGSIIIIVLGIICVIVSVFVMRRVTKKTN